jgi:predicted CxxxxCH...CXXCH cytochrome family protein
VTNAGPRSRALTALASVALAGAALVGCSEPRAAAADPPTYADDVAPLFAARCARCHDRGAPPGGWRGAPYLAAIACVGEGQQAAVLPPGSDAPIARALAPGNEAHRSVATTDEQALLLRWLGAGAPSFRGAVHAPAVADPRSPSFHGAALRARRWAPMLDPNDDDACGRCHDGVASRPAGVTRPAPGATACTSCHALPEGVLACGTCHGDDARSYPPRDPCFFPVEAARAGAHRAHVEQSGLRTAPLACAACHPSPAPGVLSGLHGDGHVDVALDPAVAGPDASYDPASRSCDVSCHHRADGPPTIAWDNTEKLGCGSCHGSPPANHYPGKCTTCHHEANAAGTALSGGPMHMNGKVDLGDGSGGCGACHGAGADPAPSGGSHPVHLGRLVSAPPPFPPPAPPDAKLAEPFGCDSCHQAIDDIHAPGHMDGVATISFGPLATARGAQPTWNGASCSAVACHGAGLVEPPLVVPTWGDTSGAASACGACHGVPPKQHTPSTSCNRVECHGDEVGREGNALWITQAGSKKHVNGVIDAAH